METLIQNNEKPLRTNEEFALNYKRAPQDGIYGPVAVGNINEHNGRFIINLCMKTMRSGERNATYSQPIDWKLKVATGDYVSVLVQNGYVTKVMPITPKPLSSMVAKVIENASGIEQSPAAVEAALEPAALTEA